MRLPVMMALERVYPLGDFTSLSFSKICTVREKEREEGEEGEKEEGNEGEGGRRKKRGR